MRQSHALIARVMQLRASGAARNPEPAGDPVADQPQTITALEARIAHLEHLVEGLQDSVHRESSRQSARLAALEAQLDPAALAVALDQDARERGI